MVETRLIDGKAHGARLRAAIAEAAQRLKAASGVVPGLVTVRVGEDPASQIYVRSKGQASLKAGFRSFTHHLPASASEVELRTLVDRLNADPAVDGVLVQLPLPPALDARRVIDALDPAKDVDGFHPENLGRLMLGTPTVVPCTPAGILAILDHYEIPLAGKTAVVIGRSRIVGKPVAQLLLARDCTVTMAHSKTRALSAVARQADVLVVATGRPRLIGADYVKDGATVIDVGINRLPTGKVVGDVDFEAVAPRASAITPVPGGVGLMTVAMLMRNTVRACRRQTGA